MQFKLIGHASVLVSHDDYHIITDPWFGYDFQFGTFHMHPPIQPPNLATLEKINAIHISHIHQDHLCVKSLALFPKHTPVIITNHIDKTFRDKVARQGFKNIIEIAPKDEYQLGPFSLRTFIPEIFDGSFDSSAIISIGDDHFYFMNDCRLSREQYLSLRKLYKSFAGCFLNYNSVNPYPTCYDFKVKDRPDLTTQNELFRTTGKGLDHFELVSRTLEPKWITPYAGHIRFLREDLFIHNRIFEGLRERLDKQIKPMSLLDWWPGDTVNEKGEFVTPQVQTPSSPLPLPVVEKNQSVHISEQRLKILFEDFFKRNSKSWTEPMSVRFRVHFSDKFQDFDFCTDTLPSNNSIECDLLVEYDAWYIEKILSHERAFANVHYGYGFKATLFNVKPYPQCLVHRWQ